MRFLMNLSKICMSLGGIDLTPLNVREEDQLGIKILTRSSVKLFFFLSPIKLLYIYNYQSICLEFVILLLEFLGAVNLS